MPDVDRWLREQGVFGCPREADFFQAWRVIVGRAPIEQAVRGGASADRLAWVFMSGYQAALASCFPEFAGDGWVCLANTEPKDVTPCALIRDDGGWRLCGEKSWIAGAEHVARLIVTVSDPIRFVRVERDRRGVAVGAPGTPTFLAELSQGVARFDDVLVTNGDVLDDPQRMRRFRAAEPLFVLLALNGFIGSHSRGGDRGGEVITLVEAAILTAAGLVDSLDDGERMKPGLAALRRATADAVARFGAARRSCRLPTPTSPLDGGPMPAFWRCFGWRRPPLTRRHDRVGSEGGRRARC